jgi:regulation of enolase protein 1 (concanavalin A-like superfamily)
MKGEIEVAATVENHPTAQYEQVDLVWYYNDSYMVKLGLELVDGKLSIVMSREESDRTRTIKIIPTKETTVQLLLRVKGNQIHGRFRTPASNDWQDVGECDLPAPPEHRPKISLQFYQGPADAEHWARVTELRITLGGGKIHSALGRIRNESRSRQAIHRLGAIEQSMERRRSRRHAIDRWDRGTAVSRQDGAVVCLVLEQGRAARNQRGPR